MATTGIDELDRRCHAIAASLSGDFDVADAASTVGAGSVPGAEVPSRVLAHAGAETDRMYLELISGRTPVVGRRDRGRLLIDLRAIDPCIDGVLTRSINEAVERCRS